MFVWFGCSQDDQASDSGHPVDTDQGDMAVDEGDVSPEDMPDLDEGTTTADGQGDQESILPDMDKEELQIAFCRENAAGSFPEQAVEPDDGKVNYGAFCRRRRQKLAVIPRVPRRDQMINVEGSGTFPWAAKTAIPLGSTSKPPEDISV